MRTNAVCARSSACAFARGDATKRAMTGSRPRAVTTRALNAGAIAGRREEKQRAKGEATRRDAKATTTNGMKPPTEAGASVRIGSFTVSVPAEATRALERAPKPALYAGGALALLVLKKVVFRRKAKKGSLGDLEERGMLDENRDVDEDKFFKGMMKTVRTVEMPELTEEQILAARERRRQSSAGNDNFEKSLAEAEIPANHPWATKENLTAAEQREAEQRVLELNRPRKRRSSASPE